MEWTKEQKAAIESKEDKNILLAAAAGSGKTAVLVERIINKIKSKENPMSVSNMLVLTFTEAAAAEMKRKISAAIKKELEKDSENEHLRQQAIALHSASISTVHAFCNRLLKGHIHKTSLPAEYALASDSEAKLLLKQAIDKVLEKHYQRLSLLPSFLELTESYGGVKGDGNLRSLLFDLYLFSKSLPYPNEWLRKSIETYKVFAEEKSYENTIFGELKKEQTKVFVNDILSCYDGILSITKTLPEGHKYPPFYEAERDLVVEILKSCDKDKILGFSFPAKVRKQNICPTEEQTADRLRDLAKDIMADFKGFLSAETEEEKELSKRLFKRAKTLKNIVIMIDRAYMRLKKEKNLLDFSDLEHGLLSLLSDKDHNPTPVALELRGRYQEILLDEYQDTNSIQEEIFRLLSRDEKNIFMVGDLKQCIYKFRNAAPELFAEKRLKYKEDENVGRLLNLSKNFRSRSEVIGTVNFIFSSIMSEGIGDIDYAESEYLKLGAEYPPAGCEDDFETEFYVVTGSEDTPASDTEAEFIAKRIEEIVAKKLMVYDTKLGEKRAAEYRDIVILLRHRSFSAALEETLSKRGIPATSDASKSYLDSPEVGTIISFLNIIDNPYQDIPLIATLRSKMFGFTAEELAEIRLKKQNCWFFDALTTAADEGFIKAKSFLEDLEKLRYEAQNSSIYKLILTIYERFNCLATAGLMTNPPLRRANLKLLAQRAMDYENKKGGGLFGFMNYLEKLKADGGDLASAKTVSEGENAVRIMTIHKSQGLEFPIVFLSDTSHKFNTKDISRGINFHQEAGLSLGAVDTKLRIKYPSLSSALFKTIIKRELLSEEMRLLYVALTRAKEKLIITSAIDPSSNQKSTPLYDENKKPLTAHLKRMQNFSGWLLASLLPHPEAKELRALLGYEEDMVSTKADFKLKVGVIDTVEEGEVLTEHKEEKKNDREFKISDIEEILSYTPDAGDKIPLKITVSEVKRRLSEDVLYTPRLTSSKNIYLKQKEELTAQERGTITHFVLQHLDEKKITTEEDLGLALEKAVTEGVISGAQKSVVDTKKLMRFFESNLGRRLRKSAEVYKEYSFYSKIEAGKVFDEIQEDKKGTEILLQGTIDCFFIEEDGKMVLVDYKTDNVSKDETAARASHYKVQIDCYNEALLNIFGKKADESYIYFLNCDTEVKMD